jgi:hypothetical protein
MTTEIAPQWLIDKIKAARAVLQKQIDNSVEYGHNTLVISAKIAVYNDILSMMEREELSEFAAKLRLKYK